MTALTKNPRAIQTLLVAAGIALTSVGILFLISSISTQQILPKPGPTPQEIAYPPNIEEYLAAVIESQTKEPERYEALLPEGEFTDLKEHIANTAAKRGWVVHNLEFRSIDVVLPRSQLQEIEHLMRDTASWVQSVQGPQPQTDTQTETRPQPVNVRIQLRDPSLPVKILKVLGATFSTMLGITIVITRIVLYRF